MRPIHCYGVIFMFEAFVGAVFIGLILFGLLSLCYCLMVKAMQPKKKFDYYIVIRQNAVTAMSRRRRMPRG